ncbi:MAG TPA: hypothetical protein DHW78_01725 [Ruminococcaceae bacterium]|nr:hypothetical protein [Oscillospiraceae bacterium]HCM23036.1 hypothetical protein [Oscillospiraceae bacterium]
MLCQYNIFCGKKEPHAGIQRSTEKVELDSSVFSKLTNAFMKFQHVNENILKSRSNFQKASAGQFMEL